MPESTMLVLAGLGVLAWLLAGGWPYARDTYVADDGPVGLGAGVTAVCPACVASVADVTTTVGHGAGRREVRTGPDGGPTVSSAVPGLRPLAVGRDQSLRLECPACGSAYTVVGTSREARVVPAPRGPVD